MRRKGTDLEALRSVEVVVSFQLDSLVVVSPRPALSVLHPNLISLTVQTCCRDSQAHTADLLQHT